ncbi:MAG: PAS domain S-box protein [Chloroflexota bacterium]
MKLLYVEDELAHVALTRRTLEENPNQQFELLHTETIAGAIDLLDSNPDIELILSDLRLPDGSGLDLLARVNLRTAPPPVVLVTGQGDEQAAVVALKAGAVDYLVKQTDYLHRLPVVLNNAVAQSRLGHEQNALREAEFRYQSLVEQIPVVVFLDNADEQESGIYISPRIESLTGYSPEEWLADATLWDRVIHPDDQIRIKEAYDFSHKNETPFVDEYRIVRKDGAIVWIKESTFLVRDDAGNPRYWQGILLDITKEKETQAAIREGEERFRRIFHSSPIATCVVSLEEGKFIDANTAFVDLIGIPLNDLVGRTSVELGFWSDDVKRTEFIQTLQEKRFLHGVDVRYPNSPNGPRDTVAFYEAVELGREPCVLAMFYDVTEQKKSQQAIQAERDFALQVLNNMGQGLTVTTEENRFEYVNPSYALMLGYSQADIIGKQPADFTSETAMHNLQQQRELRKHGKISTYESVLIHKDGHEVPVVITGVPRWRNDRIAGAIAVITDLTAIKRAETSLARQVKELTVLHSAAIAEAEFASSEDEVIERITTIISQLYSEVCGILLLNDAGDLLTPHRSYLGADVSNWQAGYPITEGITGKVVRTGTPIRLGDITSDPMYIEIASGIRSELCVPIRVNERIIGVLNVESKTPNAFTDGDERFLTIVAGGLGSALERIRLFAAEQRRVRELEIINRMSATLRKAQSLDDMPAILLQQALDLIRTPHGSIWLHDQSYDVLVQRAAHGAESKLSVTSIKPWDGIIGRVFTRGEMHLSTDLNTDPLLIEANRESMQPGLAGITLPIQSTAGPVGVLRLGIEAGRQVTPAEINLLSILAEITGNAIHRTELFDHSQEQIRRLTALRDIDSAIASSTDLRVTLNILSEHALKHLKVDAMDIFLYRPELQSLNLLSSAAFRTPSPSRPMLRIGEGLAGQVLVKGRIDHVIDLMNSAEAKKDPLLAREGFVTYIGVPLIVKGQIKGVFEVFHRTPLSPGAEWMQFLQTLAGQAAIAIDNAHLFDNLQKTNQELTQAYDITLEGWARALELRDRETEGHTRRVTDMTMRLAKSMGINDEELVNIYRGVLLHDIGKMGVPDHILKKTGPLTDSEWDEMRRHPQYAYDLLSPITYLRPVLDIPYCHHEHWDGSGYPRGLKGEQIPLSARIFSVVDIWDALRSNRPYRNAWPVHKVLEYIKENAGTILDPEIVNVFLRLVDEDNSQS